MKSITAVIPVMIMCACAQKNTTSKPVSHTEPAKSSNLNDTVLVYHSAANGTANLELTMLANHTFNFHVQTIPLDDPKAIDENLKGVWKESQDSKRLFFKGHKPLVKSLFDSIGVQNKQFVIVNDSIVDINDKLSGIFIGGILCEKRKQKP